MSFFVNNNEEEEKEESSSGNGFAVITGIFSVLFAPVTVVTVAIFLLFMRGLRWKPSVTIFPLAFVFLLMYMFSSNALSTLNGFSLAEINENWTSLLMVYIYGCVMIGIITGFIYVLFKAWDLRRYPEYKYISGWAYDFEYVPTPLEKLRKKRNIKALKSGALFDYEKAPIGVIDAPVKSDDLERTVDVKNANKASIVYRYYSEAMAHTLITGKTGSGKALHISTKIRTKEHGLTTVGQVRVGDTLYDENGNHTTLLAIYKPMTPDHYEIIFENGEIVKCCGDHLWNIGDVEEEHTFPTRYLYEHFNRKVPFRISHSIDEIRRKHKIIGIREIHDNPNDYICFTVDSPSKLFLITESNIPTHNTVTMLSLIQNDVLSGHPVCVIDFKKSPDLIYFLSKWAKENGREFYHFVSGKPGTYKNPNQKDQATYDPLSTGGATSKADMILNLRSWDSASEVFKKRTQDVLQSLFFLLERTPREAVPGIDWDSGGLAQFVSALDLNNFRKMIEYMSKDMTKGNLSAGDIRRYNTLVELYKELSAKTKSDLKAQIVELLSIARTLIVSNYGDWLATGASPYHIDLMKIATSQDGPVVLFSFNQQEEPEFAKYIGSIVMSDLSRVSALKNAKGDTTKFGVYIDEFQTLDPKTVKDNLEKARSSKMYITLSLQSIDQIVSSVETGDGNAMANAIIDTCSNFIFHDGSGYDTAEKMSKIIGKSNKYVYRTTSNTRPGIISRLVTVDNAMVSKDIQEDWLVPPSEFQSLESPTSTNGYKATAYIVNKASDDNRFKRSGGALARKVHVVVASETANGIPPEFKKAIYIEPGKNFEKLQTEVLRDMQDSGIRLEASIDSSNDDGGWTITDVEEEQDLLPGITSSPKLEERVPVEETIAKEETKTMGKENLNSKKESVKGKTMNSLPSLNEELSNKTQNFNEVKLPSITLPTINDVSASSQSSKTKENFDIQSEKQVNVTKNKPNSDIEVRNKKTSESPLDVFNQLKNQKKTQKEKRK